MGDAFKLGFLLYEYFPFGGLQRDCLRTALVCAERGHSVTILTRAWEGDRPAGLKIECLGRRGWSNVSRNKAWLGQVRSFLAAWRPDGVVGFNKLPDLDVHFGADPCYVAKMARLRPAWYRWMPRYRFYRRMEEAVFARGRSTRILLLTGHEIPRYREIYGTEPERIHLLPPGIARHIFGREEQRVARERVRREQGWGSEERLLVFVGSGFRVKGLDRAIAAMASLPNPLRSGTRLVVIGKGRPGAFAAQARRSGVGEQVHFLGARDDVPRWLLAADLLLHPAYSESAGMILLEALTCGLPVLTTDTCGYATHVERAGAGCVLASPYSQAACNQALVRMLTSAERGDWMTRGLAYAAREDLYSCHEKAAEVIEETVRRRRQEKPRCYQEGSGPA